MRSKTVWNLALLALLSGSASLLAGCIHPAQFDREDRPAIIGTGPDLWPVARVRLATSRATDPRFAHALEHALRTNDNVALVATQVVADYALRLDVRRSANASATNFVLCWPGFVVFAPAWHGLEWPYTVESRVTLERPDGTRVAEYAHEAHWTARYTSGWYGLAASLGWLPPTYTITAFEVGIVSSVGEPQSDVLDRAFLASEGDRWADEVAATAVKAIAHDRAAMEWRRPTEP